MSNDEAVEIIEEVAIEIDGEIRNNYSGRFMYGETCYGIVCAEPTSCIEEAASRGLRGAKTDNMGREFIVYWPSVHGV